MTSLLLLRRIARALSAPVPAQPRGVRPYHVRRFVTSRCVSTPSVLVARRPRIPWRATVPHMRMTACGCACQGKAASRKKTAYIALGSNLGDRVAEIERACNEMDRRGIKVRRTSSLWETEPMYVKDQDRFVNGACEVCHFAGPASWLACG